MSNNKIIKYLSLASSVAQSSTHYRFQLGAVLVSRKSITTGTNANKTHPKQKERTNKLGMVYGKHHIHAELDCLIRADFSQIAGSTIYVSRLTSYGYGIAKPCEVCEELLREYRVKRAIFTLSSKELNQFGVLEL